MEASIRKTAKLAELLQAMRELNDPIEPEAADYRRGQLDLVAYLFGVQGMPTDERMEEIAKHLGWPMP